MHRVMFKYSHVLREELVSIAEQYTPYKGWIYSPVGRISIKMASYQYRKSHCVDKIILRPSYLHNGIPYTGKM